MPARRGFDLGIRRRPRRGRGRARRRRLLPPVSRRRPRSGAGSRRARARGRAPGGGSPRRDRDPAPAGVQSRAPGAPGGGPRSDDTIPRARPRGGGHEPGGRDPRRARLGPMALRPLPGGARRPPGGARPLPPGLQREDGAVGLERRRPRLLVARGPLSRTLLARAIGPPLSKDSESPRRSAGASERGARVRLARPTAGGAAGVRPGPGLRPQLRRPFGRGAHPGQFLGDASPPGGPGRRARQRRSGAAARPGSAGPAGRDGGLDGARTHRARRRPSGEGVRAARAGRLDRPRGGSPRLCRAGPRSPGARRGRARAARGGARAAGGGTRPARISPQRGRGAGEPGELPLGAPGSLPRYGRRPARARSEGSGTRPCGPGLPRQRAGARPRARGDDRRGAIRALRRSGRMGAPPARRRRVDCQPPEGAAPARPLPGRAGAAARRTLACGGGLRSCRRGDPEDRRTGGDAAPIGPGRPRGDPRGARTGRRARQLLLDLRDDDRFRRRARELCGRDPADSRRDGGCPREEPGRAAREGGRRRLASRGRTPRRGARRAGAPASEPSSSEARDRAGRRAAHASLRGLDRRRNRSAVSWRSSRSRMPPRRRCSSPSRRERGLFPAPEI